MAMVNKDVIALGSKNNQSRQYRKELWIKFTLANPCKNNGPLSSEKRHFNYKLSQSRIIVQKAFGLLKFFEFTKTEAIPMYVLSACVLHNFCITSLMKKLKLMSTLTGQMIPHPLLQSIQQAHQNVTLCYL